MATGERGEEGSARRASGPEASRQTTAVTHREVGLGLQNPQFWSWRVDQEHAVRRLGARRIVHVELQDGDVAVPVHQE